MKTKLVFVSALFAFFLFGSYAIYKEHFSNEVLVRFDMADVEIIPTPTAEEEIQPQLIAQHHQPAKPVKRYAVTSDLKKQVPKIGFKQIVPEPRFENLRMIGKVGRNAVDDNDGKLLRVLRLKPITDAVEYRYNLPAGIVLAMAAHEASAALMTNGGDDGGAGDCHMQPDLADMYGLKVYQNCDDRVNHAHGRALRVLISTHKLDMRSLSSLDDRLHSIKNLDAVGRMLALHIQTKAPTHPRYNGTDQLQAALFRYSGRPNNEYWDMVMAYRKQLRDPKKIDRVMARFNALNPKLIIDGEKGNLELYLHACWRRWVNFGLNEYKKMPLYSPKGSEKILARYGPAPKP